jgi:hypothetical protein
VCSTLGFDLGTRIRREGERERGEMKNLPIGDLDFGVTKLKFGFTNSSHHEKGPLR